MKPLFDIIKNSGAVGNYLLNKDWSDSTLGDITTWPIALIRNLANILSRKIPTFIYWGDEHICFYNDAFIPSLGNIGKHPILLGMPARLGWGEIYEQIKDDIKKVYLQGEATLFENRLLPISRNGDIEHAYWTYGHSPLHDDTGNIEGVIISLIETTSQLSQIESLSISTRKIVNLIKSTPFAMCYINGKSLNFEIVNKYYLELIDKQENKVLHHNLYDVLPEVKEHLKDIFDIVRIKGEQFEAKEFPVTLNINGKEKQGYYDFVYHPIYNESDEYYDILVIAFDVTDYKINRDKMAASEHMYKKLADSMPQIVWIADGDGVLNYWNKVTFDFAGLTFEDLKGGTGWVQMIHPDDAEQNVARWVHSVQTGEDYLIEHRFRDKNGDYKWMMSRALPVRDEHGEIEMWVGTSTDIHEKKQLEIHKDEFIKMANHELKTPITSIKGYTQLLIKSSDKVDDPIATMSINAVNAQVLKLEKLIDDMLDLSRIETGTLPINKSHFDLKEILNMCIKDIKIVHKNININVASNDDLPAISHVDIDRISQVFYNIINNAIKYAPNSHNIDIKISNEKKYCDIAIRDYGIGIKEEHLERLFDRFYRVPGDTERKFAGFGIGLFLVKEIIDKHEGKITVESEIGQGTNFIISLPLSTK